MAKESKQLYCDFCGADCGFGTREWREKITCGQRECEQWARDEDRGEREEAHERLDRDMGYGQW